MSRGLIHSQKSVERMKHWFCNILRLKGDMKICWIFFASEFKKIRKVERDLLEALQLIKADSGSMILGVLRKNDGT